MTNWRVAHGDILEIAADGLICSANPRLQLSGGVGGALSLRHGQAMQEALRELLRSRSLRHVEPGQAVVVPSCGTPYRAVAHAVAIDAFYDTNAALIVAAYRDAIDQLVRASSRTVAAACLGCGYGRCPIPEFLRALHELRRVPLPQLDELTFVTTNRELAEAIAEQEGMMTKP